MSHERQARETQKTSQQEWTAFMFQKCYTHHTKFVAATRLLTLRRPCRKTSIRANPLDEQQ